MAQEGGGNGDGARRRSASEASEFPVLETPSLAKLGFPDAKKDPKRKRARGLVDGGGGKAFLKNAAADTGSGKERPLTAPASLADFASKERLTAGEVRSLFQGSMQREARLPPAEKKKEKIPFLRRQRH